jgi:hypothetical protein
MEGSQILEEDGEKDGGECSDVACRKKLTGKVRAG